MKLKSTDSSFLNQLCRYLLNSHNSFTVGAFVWEKWKIEICHTVTFWLQCDKFLVTVWQQQCVSIGKTSIQFRTCSRLCGYIFDIKVINLGPLLDLFGLVEFCVTHLHKYDSRGLIFVGKDRTNKHGWVAISQISRKMPSPTMDNHERYVPLPGPCSEGQLNWYNVFLVLWDCNGITYSIES